MAASRACLCGSTTCSHRRGGRRKPGTYGGQYQTNRAVLLARWVRDPETRCYYCGLRAKTDDPWETDHIIPVVQGGNDHISNLRPAHRSCNRAAGARLKQRRAKEAADRRAEERYRATLELIQGGRR